MASYTLRQLKYFVTTVECGSVAEASRQRRDAGMYDRPSYTEQEYAQLLEEWLQK